MILGIDISKDKLDVILFPEKKHYIIHNSHQSIQSFLKTLLKNDRHLEMVVFEATGGYEKLLMLSLLKLSIPFHRAHPTRVYHFAKSKGYFAKTDRIDAMILAQYAAQEDLAPSNVSVNQLKLQELSARKTQVKEMIGQERSRLSCTYLNTKIKQSIQRQMKQLEKEVEWINEELEDNFKKDQAHDKKRKLLRSIMGVGYETSTLLVTDLPELGQLTREQISNLIGVAPRTKESGKKQSYRAISHGRSQIRKVLYMAALVAMRYNNRMKEFYRKLIQAGKKPKVALVAIMRKLIIIMNAMVRDSLPWQEQRI
ncbi:MAG: IS110 family transposase [Vallitaleaceae bacterium]|nr:IS110 family transposase [Vallitaleaceae bacterium]